MLLINSCNKFGEPNFRGFYWGDKRSDIAKAEKDKRLKYSTSFEWINYNKYEINNGLSYEGSVIGFGDTKISYFFDNDNELRMAKYSFASGSYIKEPIPNQENMSSFDKSLAETANSLGSIFDYGEKLDEYREELKYSRKHLDDFNAIKEKLISKYGSPTSNREQTQDGYKCNEYSPDEAKLDCSVASGCYAYLTTWEKWHTTIELILIGGRNRIRLDLTYRDSDIGGFLRELRKEKESNKPKGL